MQDLQRAWVTAPAGGVVNGHGYLIGSLFVVALVDADAAAHFEGATVGVFSLEKTSAQAWTEGQAIYWNTSTKKADSDPTTGPLIGAAAAAAANPSSTGSVQLRGAVPGGASGGAEQPLIAALTDNSGGATADGTIGAVTAPTALTDSTTGTAGATLAAITSPTAVTNSSGGSTADTTIAAITQAGTAGSADITPTKDAIAKLAVLGNANAAAVILLKNDAASLAARQAENRTAIVALTDAVKELSTKSNAILAALKLAGIIASA
jgi:predicted RecA/RadA family phage recombinase